MGDSSVSASGRRKRILGITLTALFAALIAAGTFISIPLPFSPVPIVLQNLFALLSGLVLGPALGAAAAAVYLAAGAIGAPVFAGASGGFVHFLGPTGGFLCGYFFAAAGAGLIAGRPRAGVKTPLWRIILAAAAGLLIVYVPGLIRLKAAASLPWGGTFIAGFLPFLPGDIVKAVAAVLISPRLRKLTADIFD
ncbi:MAG: biotin transporter BioY [Treponema sp.]|jgi:biotin transport system substrate-specific component|nr:biotin transporter BioY [Treponema sp.]